MRLRLAEPPGFPDTHRVNEPHRTLTPSAASPELGAPLSRAAIMAVVVASLGYFVDIYDLILFSVVRVPSLKGLGATESEVLTLGASLISWQMFGMVVGGLAWGILGDKKGRLSVLFGSIILYSMANIANGLVATVEPGTAWGNLLATLGMSHGIDQYRALRFIAGIGLAGELGAGVTLVSELLGRHARGYGTTIVATFGICGGLMATFVAGKFDWRTAYFVGGGMGLALLVLRIGVVESGMFKTLRTTTVVRGSLLMLFWPPRRFLRYAAIVLVAVPIWFVVAIPVTFAPEFGKQMGFTEPLSAPTAIAWTYTGLVLGDLASGLLSQFLRSRRRALLVFLLFTTATLASFFIAPRFEREAWSFYTVCAVMGLSIGYWAVFVTTVGELFGTNLRATATTSAPNLVRGFVPLLTWAWLALVGAGMSHVNAAAVVGFSTIVVAMAALASLPETYGRHLDFLEGHGRD